MIFTQIKEFFGASEVEAMSTKQIQRQIAINTLQAQKIELDKKETASTIALTQANITELATKKGVTDATLLELKSKLGLEATEKGVWATTKALTVADVEQALATLSCDATTKEYIKTILVQNGAMKEQITLSGLLNKALGVITAHPVIATLTAIAAIGVAVWAINDALTTTAEEAQESLKELQDVTAELETLNSELEDIKNRIDELNARQNLSLVEAEELEKLKEANRQLEIERRNQEAIAKQKKQEANDDALDYFNYGHYALSSGGFGNRVDLLEDQLNQIAKLEEELKSYSGDVNDVVYKNQKIALENMKSAVSDALSEFMATDDGLVEGMDDGLKERLSELYNLRDIVFNGAAQNYTDAIEGAFEKVEFKGFKDKLIALEKDGKLSVGLLAEDFEGLVQVLNDAGVSAEELYKYIQYLANPDGLDYSVVKDQLFASMGVNTRQPGKYAYDAISMFQNRGLLTNEALDAYISVKAKFAGKTDTWTPEDWAAHIEDELNSVDATVNVSFSDILALENADGEATVLGELNKQVDELQTAWSGLREMMDNYNKTGTITVDQFQDLLSYGDEYLQYLTDENGNLQLNEEALKKVAAARIENMKAQILNDMYSNLNSITDEASAQDFLKDKINHSTLAIAENTAEIKNNIKERLKWMLQNGDIANSTVVSISNYVNNTIAAMDKLSGSISTASFSGAETDWKDLLDKETNLLEKQLEAHVITFDDYVDKRRDIIEKYYRDGLISAEDYYSALEDMYDYQLSTYDKVIGAVTGLIDDEIESLEDEKETIEKNYQTKIDSIQEEIDLLQEANDKKQTQIDLEKAQYELEKARNQRTKKVYTDDKGYIYTADTEAIRDAEDDLADKELQLNISKLESQIESLEKEMNETTKGIDDQIEALEDYRDKWNEIPDEWQKAQDLLLAQQILGLQDESEILALREDILNTFRDNYIASQNAMAQAAVDSANIQIQAAKEAAKGANGTILEKPGTEYISTDYKSKGGGGAGKLTMMKYHDGLEKGYVGAKYRPLSDDDRLKMFQRFGNGQLKPGEVPAILKQGELVMTPEQQINIVKNMQMLYGGNFAQYSRQPQATTVTIGDIHLHEVQNVNDFGAELNKYLPGISIQHNGKH